MISKFFLVPVLALTVFASCKSRSFNSSTSQSTADSESAAEPFFILKDGLSSYFKSAPREANELNGEFCNLKPGKKYTFKGPVYEENKHYFFEKITNSEFDCGLEKGYVFAEHITIEGAKVTAKPSSSSNPDSPYCQYSWEERPGTTDYTTIDKYRGVQVKGDRPQSQTLVGSGIQSGQSLCQKARRLNHCFVRTIIDSQEPAARRFRQWASARGIDPVRALMAKTEQETFMGTIHDSCSGGSCNGIGIAQIITAIAPNGARLGDSDSRWSGVTFNILTNLAYSVRVVEEKISSSGTLYDLAYNYNGSSGAARYASNVVKYYNQLKSCSL
jgi:hypothetical protein